MVHKILVTPREAAKAFTIGAGKDMERIAIISICSSEKEVLFTYDVVKRIGCRNVITMIFADLTAVDYKIHPLLCTNYPMFSTGMAKTVITFLDNIRNQDIGMLLIHCDAGISRSGAIGVFAVRYFGMDEKAFRRENRAISPNKLVYDTLAAVSGIRGDYENWWENINLNIDEGLIF